MPLSSAVSKLTAVSIHMLTHARTVSINLYLLLSLHVLLHYIYSLSFVASIAIATHIKARFDSAGVCPNDVGIPAVCTAKCIAGLDSFYAQCAVLNERFEIDA